MLSSIACCSKSATSLYRSLVVSTQSCILSGSVSCTPPGLYRPAHRMPWYGAWCDLTQQNMINVFSPKAGLFLKR